MFVNVREPDGNLVCQSCDGEGEEVLSLRLTKKERVLCADRYQMVWRESFCTSGKGWSLIYFLD